MLGAYSCPGRCSPALAEQPLAASPRPVIMPDLFASADRRTKNCVGRLTLSSQAPIVALSTNYDVLNTMCSLLNTKHYVLTTMCSLLYTSYDVLGAQYSLRRPVHPHTKTRRTPDPLGGATTHCQGHLHLRIGVPRLLPLALPTAGYRLDTRGAFAPFTAAPIRLRLTLESFSFAAACSFNLATSGRSA